MPPSPGPSMGQPLHFSTDSLPERDRIAIWRETYGRMLFNVDIEPVGDTPFRADVTLRALSDVRISTGSRTEARYGITRELLHNATDMVGLVMMRTGRAYTAQRGREATIEKGEAISLWTSETLTQTVLDNGHHLAVYIPRKIFAPMVRDIDAALLRPIPAATDALQLLIDYVTAAQRLDGDLSPALQRSISGHLCDLVALALGATKDAAEIAQLRGLRAARAQQIFGQIEANFASQGFSAHEVARKLGVSPRYVQDLLQETGSSFTERVMEYRLQRACQMLAARHNDALKVSDIAYSCGFSNVSYFNQAFRRRFGATPTQYRGGNSGDHDA